MSLITPTHYVAFYQTAPSAFEVLGYYHVTWCEEYALVGGLCVDPRYGKHGLGEKLFTLVFDYTQVTKVFFSYLGNPVSVRIARRIGYIDTGHQNLMARFPKKRKNRSS